MEEYKDDKKLVLIVDKPIWLAVKEPKFEIIGWTTTKPEHDNGFIDKNHVLMFLQLSHVKDTSGRQPLEFIIIHPGPIPGEFPADFYEEEIDSLVKEGALRLLDTKDVGEMTIAIKDVFIQYPEHKSFGSPVILPYDIYIIMGPREMKQSGAKIVTGEKISLRHLLDVYSIAVGQNLILK